MTTNEKKTTNTNETTESEKNTVKRTNKKTVGLIVGATVTVAAVLISMLCLSACNDKKPTATADEVIGTSVQTVTQVVTDSQGNTHIEEATKVVEVKQTPASNSGSSGSSSQSKPSSGSGSSSSSKPEPAPTPQPATKDPHEGKTWHEAEYKTEQVWVVDEEACTWQRPIIESHRASICNTCGEEITGHTSEHMFAHMDKGENGSYRIETVDEIVGYETVEEPEVGHWETKTELVREAGWY